MRLVIAIPTKIFVNEPNLKPSILTATAKIEWQTQQYNLPWSVPSLERETNQLHNLKGKGLGRHYPFERCLTLLRYSKLLRLLQFTYKLYPKKTLSNQSTTSNINDMSSLPPTMNFADVEVDICKKWQADDTFRLQNKLSEERGDEVSYPTYQFTHLFVV